MLHLHLYMARVNYLTEHITAKYFEVVPLEIPWFPSNFPKAYPGSEYTTPHLIPTLKEVVIFSLEVICWFTFKGNLENV